MGLFSFFRQELAVDLGTANTLIIEKPKKIEGFIDNNTAPRKPGYIELESSSPNSRYKNPSRL